MAKRRVRGRVIERERDAEASIRDEPLLVNEDEEPFNEQEKMVTSDEFISTKAMCGRFADIQRVKWGKKSVKRNFNTKRLVRSSKSTI